MAANEKRREAAIGAVQGTGTLVKNKLSPKAVKAWLISGFGSRPLLKRFVSKTRGKLTRLCKIKSG